MVKVTSKGPGDGECMHFSAGRASLAAEIRAGGKNPKEKKELGLRLSHHPSTPPASFGCPRCRKPRWKEIYAYLTCLAPLSSVILVGLKAAAPGLQGTESLRREMRPMQPAELTRLGDMGPEAAERIALLYWTLQKKHQCVFRAESRAKRFALNF